MPVSYDDLFSLFHPLLKHCETLAHENLVLHLALDKVEDYPKDELQKALDNPVSKALVHAEYAPAFLALGHPEDFYRMLRDWLNRQSKGQVN